MAGQRHAQTALNPGKASGTYWRGGWEGSRTYKDGFREEKTVRPATSESLYPLNYPGLDVLSISTTIRNFNNIKPIKKLRAGPLPRKFLNILFCINYQTREILKIKQQRTDCISHSYSFVKIIELRINIPRTINLKEGTIYFIQFCNAKYSKSRRRRWAGNVACMGEQWCAYGVLVDYLN